MTQEASMIEKIKVILKGIDQTEIESEDGWWETSTGAKLGAEALKQILELLAQKQEPVPPPWWPAVENILNEYGLQAIDFVADFKQALAQKREPIAMLFGSLPVYDDTTPPQRTWVGLTDKEITALLMPFPKYPSEWDDPDFYRLTQAIEAKLKEKNT